MLSNREYRHLYYRRFTAAYEALRITRRLYPWRAADMERLYEEEEFRRARAA